ncbi:MAG: hypothetical protein GXP19_01485 [Gammaproteobacteria bacterium]|nr:hypothetical protein [Gammaproteobacteria bacterium]
MFNLNQLSDTVQNNCHISDAYHAGNYSMCTFLLKMREYYRWEQQIPLSQPLPKSELGEWLVDRESMWQEITSLNPDEEYLSLRINNKDLGPFDSTAINEIIQKEGYIYSSGYGLFSKPHFFLGKLQKKNIIEDYTLAVSSREYARDLTAPPAMLQGSTIFIRQESVRRFIWEKIEEWQWKKKPDVPMARAIELYGGDSNIEHILDKMVHQETKSMFYHEVGEIKAGNILGKQWEEMLITLARSKAEILVRAVRDLLADCIYTLPTLLERDYKPSLHFYFANFSGIRKTLFPEAYDAYNSWIKSNDTAPLYRACDSGKNRWHEKAQEILALYRQERSLLEKQIELLF